MRVDPAEIRFQRRRLDLTQAELAYQVGVTPRAVRRWEAGHRQPQGPTLRRLLAVLPLGRRN